MQQKVETCFNVGPKKTPCLPAAEQLKARFPDFRLTGWNFLKLIRSSDDRRRIHDLMRDAGVKE